MTAPSTSSAAFDPGTGHPAGGTSLAWRQIELAVALADLCPAPPRWHGRLDDQHATCAFFLISAASVGWVEAAAANPRVREVDVSIEAMAGFAAIEASLATGRVQVVICGAGPGTVGVLWAIPGARSQGAKVLVLVPRTPSSLVGATDIQESSYREPLHLAGRSLYDEVIPMESLAEMPRIALRLRHLFARAQGAVVALSVPTDLLGQPAPGLPDLSLVESALPGPSVAAMERVAGLLTGPGGPPAFLLGSGAIAHRERLSRLIARWGAVHFATPAAAGIVPGSLGVIGNAAKGDIPQRLREAEVRCVVILGSRLGTASGGGAELLPPACPVVHVEVDPDITAGNALTTLGHRVLMVASGIGEFIDALEPFVPDSQADAKCRVMRGEQ
ncbi:MAG: hypothetical protein QOH12_3580 [Solirubrobacteraceae bacterium]|jgi:acetolactate synthase-1/2/3 large subunit|nr:hypothetical protein [Solirubrobacteraceae bacterium]